ncbi:MAG: hypothetical protein ACOX4M_04420 [Acetivibrionales bacterium]|jgi:hypothetical protein
MTAKTGKWTVLLRIMATSAVNVYAYAGIVTLRTAVFGSDGGVGAVLLYISSAIFANLSSAMFLNRIPPFASGISKTRTARFVSFMLNIRDFEYFAAKTAAWLLAVVPLASGIFLFARHGILRLLFELLPLAAAYAISLKHTRLGAAGIMSRTNVFTGFFILFSALVISNISGGLKHLRPWLKGAAYFFILAYLIIRNQEDIDVNIFNKKHVEKSILPKNMRRFNMMSVCTVFLIILLISNFKEIIASVAGLLGRVTVYAVYAVLWILDFFISKLSTIREADAPAQDNLLLVFEGISPTGNFVFNVLRNFTVLYIIYRILFGLAGRIPAYVRNIAGLVAKLLSLDKGAKPSEESDYIDESETVKPEWLRVHFKTAVKKQRRARKKLKGITDPVEKVRRMYAIVLDMLQNSGIKTEPCDTTLDILQKAAPLENIREELSALTDVYNCVRYGGVVPGEEMMSEALGCYAKTVRGFGFTAEDA